MITTRIVLYALLGGVLPSLIWLVFWDSEDSKRTAPRRLIITTFLLGALAVPLVIPFQKMMLGYFPDMGLKTFLSWAAIEEVFKFAAAYFALRSIDDRAPIDPLIYMITAALGFTALENALFIANPLLQQDVASTVLTGTLRFIGSSLLHTVSSGIVGFFLALSFYKRSWVKRMSIIVGLGLAICAHTAFNMFIINESSLSTFLTFATVWASVALLLLGFERVKAIHRRAA